MESLLIEQPKKIFKQEQQKLFASYYVNCGGNISKASELCGISSTQGATWLKTPYVQNELELIHSSLQNQLIMSNEEILELWSSIARGEIEEEEIVVEAFKGVTTARAVKRATPLDRRLKASELLAKSMNMFRPTTQINQQMVIINNESKLED